MLVIDAKNMSAIVLALIVGTIIRESIWLDKGINTLASEMQDVVDKLLPPSSVSH